jgi:hypothetical protein
MSCVNSIDLPFCFCYESARQTFVDEFFLSRLKLSHCHRTLSTVQCQHNRLLPLFEHVQQMLTNVDDRLHCLNTSSCHHSISSEQFCEQCQWNEHSTFVIVNTTRGNQTACFDLCPNDRSCGTFCFHQNMITSIDCYRCQSTQGNVTCR